MIKEIEKIINDELGKNGFKSISVSKSSRPDLCDFQSNDVFKLARELSKYPIEIGEEISAIINNIKDFDNYFKEVNFLKPGFINITLRDKFINNEIKKIIG